MNFCKDNECIIYGDTNMFVGYIVKNRSVPLFGAIPSLYFSFDTPLTYKGFDANRKMDSGELRKIADKLDELNNESPKERASE